MGLHERSVAMFFVACNGLVCPTLPSVQQQRGYGEETTMKENYSCLVSTLLFKGLTRLLGSIKLEAITFMHHCHIQNPFLCKYPQFHLLGKFWQGEVATGEHDKSLLLVRTWQVLQSYKPGGADIGPGYLALGQRSQIFLVVCSWVHIITRNVISGSRCLWSDESGPWGRGKQLQNTLHRVLGSVRGGQLHLGVSVKG